MSRRGLACHTRGTVLCEVLKQWTRGPFGELVMEQTSTSGLIHGSRMVWQEGRLPPRGQTLLTKVSELIDPITGTWDRVLIEEVFWEEDWKCILSIPIKQGMDDLIAWHFDRKGIFSVKSAYHNLVAIKGREECRQIGASSSSAEN